MLLETIKWSDGHVTQSVVEDRGQGAVDCPSDDILAKIYRKIGAAELQFWQCEHCGKYAVFFDVCRACGIRPER